MMLNLLSIGGFANEKLSPFLIDCLQVIEKIGTKDGDRTRDVQPGKLILD